MLQSCWIWSGRYWRQCGLNIVSASKFFAWFHSLHIVLAVLCLPIHTFLLYIDHGALHLTETFVTRLLKALNLFEEQENMEINK
ncbi:gamma-secretase-activating protein-like [Acipenser ruthenus]|uniref:gamma-secretase-activating protein-like n=1 Tax=Acipenser ruthenus TaxID=7906 RepID=UPI0027403B2A|nr:gamma-secretase-activating protein-like [Acipenser ruthenus]